MTEENSNSVEFIYCVCGCGFTKSKYDSHNRINQYIRGHNVKGRILSKETKQKLSQIKIQKTGGFKIHRGYKLILKYDHHSKTKSGYVYEHRLVYEQHYNCCLLPWIRLHHINHNKLDNRIENLKPVTKSQHQRLHNDEKRDLMSLRVCANCRSSNTILRIYDNPTYTKSFHWFKNPFNKEEWWCFKCYSRFNWDRWTTSKKVSQ